MSPILAAAGFRHAFFTRLGGAGGGAADAESGAGGGPLTFAAGDEPVAVRESFARAARALGVDPGRVYVLSQVHGTASRRLDGTEDRDEVIRAVGDITLSHAPGVACGVRSADCVPVLVGDRRSGAVAAIHSGWRGTVANAAAAGVSALREVLGGEGDLVAAIGPHIEACCFEVGEDVASDLGRCSPLREAPVRRVDGKTRVDLRAVVRAQLEATGIARGAIDDVRGCTVCDAELFHSYRRDRERSGRMLSAIVAR